MNSGDNTALMDKQESTFDENSEVLSSFPGELYVKDARKSFDVTKALDGCSFSAHFGEIHAIVGGNGCGKSTLAKVLSGVLPMDSGKLSILGHHPSSPAEARRIGVNTVFQEVMIADEATVLDNLFVGADGFWTKVMSVKEKMEKSQGLMDHLTGEHIDLLASAGDFPLSIKAWITIARALLCEPKVLILDESSAALDFDSTERLFEKMRELRDKGAAIIIVTHRIAELIRISDRATVMRDGKDVGVLAKSEITEDNLLSLMTGKSSDRLPSAEGAHKTSSQETVLKVSNMKVWDNSETVDFKLRKGEIVGITGLDGHGQDDFARILAGVARASSGFAETRSSGNDGNSENEFVQINSLDEAKGFGISYVSGDRKREGILPNMSIFENLLIPLYKTNSKVPGIRFIDWLGLSDIFDWEVERLTIKTGSKSNLITSLSGGNQQKVIIGRSFALHPKILVLNDPARGIDVDTKRDLYKHLREYAKEGNSVIYMSSELEEFIGFCSRVMVFRNGSIFKTFIDDEVDPVGILEGMFGRADPNSAVVEHHSQQSENHATTSNNPTIGKPAGSVSREFFSSNSTPSGENLPPFMKSGQSRGEDITRIKVKEFDEEHQGEKTEQSNIKISYFD